MSRRPTLNDVANLAGVSKKTVARVANNEPSVKEETRQRVSVAIAKLGYRMNLSARSLATSRSYRVAVLSPWISAYFVSQIHSGAADECRDRGYQLTIQKLNPVEPGSLQAFASSLREQPLDGAFLVAPLCDDIALLDLLDDEGVRYVRHSPISQPKRSDAVFGEEADGIDQLVEHLWQAGHRRFGVVRGPEGYLASMIRSEAVLEAVKRRGGDPRAVSVCQMTLRSSLFDQGLNAAETLLSQASPPTAITCYNDEVAAGVIAYAHRAGLNLPGDLAVSGFGNADFAIFTWPQLTTVRQPNAEMAATAVEWLTSPPAPEPRVRRFPVRLIIRESTAASDHQALKREGPGSE